MPWDTSMGGGGAPPVQGGGALAFPGVLLGGSDSELSWNGDLDLTRDRLYLQFESLLARPGTTELDLVFSGGWSFAMQLRDGNWTIQLYHGANTYDLFVGAAAELDATSWAVSFREDNLLRAFAGREPWTMAQLGFSGDLPFLNAQHMTGLTLDAKNMENYDVAYGQCRLIAVNAWQDPRAEIAAHDSMLDLILQSVRRIY